MSAPDHIAEFVRDPSRLVEACRDVIDALDSETDNDGGREKEAQLREIANAVARLERAGVPVPDSLREEKTRLVSELAVKKEGIEALNQLVDDLEDVLKDLKARVGRDGQSGEPKKIRKKRSRLPRTDNGLLREQILIALRELGGRGRVAEIMDKMGRHMEGALLPGDLEWRESTNEYAWQNNAKWERYRMIQDGLLRSDSPRGVWQLSEGDA